ncbi:winged helix-turn-helix transcriptional regulator [Streptomyces sp. NPDC059171]|uniref:winged helix-turn-helix transcriptional regulator n=1 Tax=unclassified Streptomyces TaxID=2593676 RepID=UPI003675553A
MLPRTYEGQDCSLARSLEVIGERWNLLIVRSALLGAGRYDEFLRQMPISRNVLADRLGRLVELGVMRRVVYQEKPVRHEYPLTPMGRELTVAVVALMQWGDRNLPVELGPPRQARHIGCDGAVQVRLGCASCGRDLHEDEVEVRRAR